MKLGDTNNQIFQENEELVFFATYQKLKPKFISFLSAQHTTLKKAFSKELESYSLEQLPNEFSLKCFMETKQDQQLILLGKYIENLFKHRITLSLDAK